MRAAWESTPVLLHLENGGVGYGVSETRLGSVRPCFRQKKVRDKGETKMSQIMMKN